MGSAFWVLCRREQGAWNGGGGILKEVTARYYNPVSLRPDPENFGSHRSLRNEFYEEKWAQTTTE